VEATRDQWQAQGILQQEPQSEAWLQMLRSLAGCPAGRTAGVCARRRAGAVLVSRVSGAKAFIPLGPRQSEAFSTRFLAIWLDPRTQYPELRQQLIGGQK
jgi:hypothetical protein